MLFPSVHFIGLLLVMLMCNMSTAQAQKTHTLPAPLDEHYVSLNHAIDLTYREAYAAADSIFRTVAEAAPDHPAAYLFLAGSKQADMMDHEDYDQAEVFTALLDTAETKADAWIEAHPDDPWGYCFLGHTRGYRAMWEAREGSWFAALKVGLKAKGAYHEALKRDSMCYDAYLGLGSYHYWKSARTEFINWTGLFVKDDKKKGVAEMKRAMADGIFCKAAAAAGLIWVYLDQKKSVEAQQLAAQWQSQYPEGKTFLWGQAFAAYDGGVLGDALTLFDTLHTRVAADTAQTYFNLIEIDYHRAECYDLMSRKERACAIADTIVSYPASDTIKKRQKDRLKDTRKFRKKQCGVEK